MLNNLQQMGLKPKKSNWKNGRSNCDLIGNEIASKSKGVLKGPQQNNSETVTNEHDEEITKERYVSPEERQEIIDELRFK